MALDRGDQREDAGRSRGPVDELVGAAPLTYRQGVIERAARSRADQ
jgi:hypothetical protein